jgi:hypothetical protein
VARWGDQTEVLFGRVVARQDTSKHVLLGGQYLLASAYPLRVGDTGSIGVEWSAIFFYSK